MQGKQLYANISICVYSSFQCFPRGWCKRKYVYMLFLKSEGQYFLGFPDSSVGKESTCNAGDPGSISGSGRSAGEGIGYPLQYSWASLVAQLVKNAGDLSSIPGLGRFPGERIGYPLWYSWASLVAQTVKNPPAVWETWVWSLGWEDPLEKGKDTPSSILAWRIPWTLWPVGLQRVGYNWATFTLVIRNRILSSRTMLSRGEANSHMWHLK